MEGDIGRLNFHFYLKIDIQIIGKIRFTDFRAIDKLSAHVPSFEGWWDRLWWFIFYDTEVVRNSGLVQGCRISTVLVIEIM